MNKIKEYIPDNALCGFLSPCEDGVSFVSAQSYAFCIKLLLKLGFNNTHKGFYFLADCIRYFEDYADMSELYGFVAEQHGKSSEDIIKRIETCIKSNANVQSAVNELMQCNICTQYATNAEVISILAMYFKHKFTTNII